MEKIAFWSIIAAIVAIGILASYRFLVLAQSNGYALPRGARFYKGYFPVAIVDGLTVVFVVLSVYVLRAMIYVAFGIDLIGLIFAIANFVLHRPKYRFTFRGKTFFTIHAIIEFFIISNFCIFIEKSEIFLISISALYIAYPLFFRVITKLVNFPFNKKNERYIIRQKKRIASLHPTIIGITGSYGKTSCKRILAHILSERFRVIETEKNYNTPMGVSLSSERVLSGEDVFIAEFGARERGDIRELCALFPPKYGILTGICAQHLETFGSECAIREEKGELPRSLEKNGGICAFNIDDKNVYRVWKSFLAKKISCATLKNAEITAKDIRIIDYKTYFTMNYKQSEYTCVTELLGRHNVENILCCVAIALNMGLPVEYLQKRIETIPQIEHRLEHRYASGIHILDDGYNANEKGVFAAIEVLQSCAGRKIVVSQGIVELGKTQRQKNQEVGEHFAKVADVMILVGPNARAIERGLKKAGYEGGLIKVGRRSCVEKVLKGVVSAGDVVLLQNDVPDYY